MFVKTTKEIAEYVGRTYNYGGDIRRAVEMLVPPDIARPADLLIGHNRTDKEIWKIQIRKYVDQITTLQENIKTAYSLIWGQCSEPMRAKLESQANHAEASGSYDAIRLLINLRSIMFNHQDHKYVVQSLHMSKQKFYLCSQSKDMSTEDYLERFKNCYEVIKQTGGSIRLELGLIDRALQSINTTRADATLEIQQQVMEYTKQCYLAVAFIMGLDRNRFGRFGK